MNWQMLSNKRTYLDPIHQDIVLDRNKPAERLVMDLIDTPEFQRLRRVHQMGVSFLTFQGAEGSRFTHSVGVMNVASKLTDLLAETSMSVGAHKPLILATALLHDLGHGPYSHATEKILDYDHEDWSCKIISGDTVVNQILSDFDPALPATIVGVLKKTHIPHWISELVSSQLDCDRMDYLLRDSYLTGTPYGVFALQRILISLEVDEDHDRIIVCGDKGQTAVEDYLFARYAMYAQVYYHKKYLAARALLQKLLSRARELGEKLCFVDEPTLKLLRREELKVSEYLQMDDVSLTYHIKRWMSDPDPILADLASRFINRRLFKTVKLPSKNSDQCRSIIERAERILKDRGFDPEYYLATEHTGIRPYDYYRPDAKNPQTNIMVRTNNGEVRELSTLSTPVEALVKGDFETYCLVYPDEVTDQIALLFEPAACR